MADQINVKKVGPRFRGKIRGAAKRPGQGIWQFGDAARFLFKGQCYDASRGLGTTCGLCGDRIRFVYVLKVIESPSDSSPEVGKLHIGECCFKFIRAVNDKLYRQLVAAAVNLRTCIEAIERDQRVFGAMESEKVESAPPLLGVAALDEDSIPQWFKALVIEGGDHA